MSGRDDTKPAIGRLFAFPDLGGDAVAKVEELRCRECGRTYEVAAIHVCSFCFAPLEPVYDYEAIASRVSIESIASGPPTLWRYADLLPVPEGADLVDLGTGFTPLVRAHRLAERLGLEHLYLKNDTANPTHSFKDRVVTVALTNARAMGFTTVACASTGNLANAVAAHAARAGLACFVFIPSDLEEAKIVQTEVYGATVVSVKGNYDDVNRLCSEVAQSLDWGFVNVNLRPFYSEGSKTLAFEITEQLGWRPPDHVVIPVASGSMFTKVRKGLGELAKVGLINESATRLHAAQAEGCSPVVKAIQDGTGEVRPVKPSTIAKSLAIGDPADGYYVTEGVKATGGRGAAVSDEKIVAGIRLLAETEGIFTETAGGVTIAALEDLANAGAFGRDEIVVALITGMGLKTAEVLQRQPDRTIEVPADADHFLEQLSLSEQGDGP